MNGRVIIVILLIRYFHLTDRFITTFYPKSRNKQLHANRTLKEMEMDRDHVAKVKQLGRMEVLFKSEFLAINYFSYSSQETYIVSSIFRKVELLHSDIKSSIFAGYLVTVNLTCF